MAAIAKVKPVWFLPRTRDRPVVSAMALGDITGSPWNPEDVLNESAPPAVPKHLLRHLEEAPWSWTRELAISKSGGVFASFLKFTGTGGDIMHTVESAHTDVYNAERLVTEEFAPNAEYIEKVLQDEGVEEAFVGPSGKKRMYMITGLKIAYGATKATEVMKMRGVHAHVGLDASAMAAPVTVAPMGHWSSSVKESQSAGKSDFVFGFKSRVLKRKKSQVKHKAYDRGAQYGLGQGDVDEGYLEGLNGDAFELENVDSGSMEEEFRMSSKVVASMEDGEAEVEYFMPS